MLCTCYWSATSTTPPKTLESRSEAEKSPAPLPVVLLSQSATLPSPHLHSSFFHIASSCLAITRKQSSRLNLKGKTPADTHLAISSCAASRPASPSVASATSATENAPSAILTCGLRLSSGYAMSAASAITKTSVSSAAVRASRMRSTASSARA